MAVKSVDRLAVLDEGMTFHLSQSHRRKTRKPSLSKRWRMFNIAPHKITFNSRPIIISSSKHSIMLQILSSHLSQT
jgi:hypothetical protein